MRLLVCFLFWAGDKEQMEKVVRLACDLLEEKTTQAEVLFVARHDCDPLPVAVQELAMKKFAKVHYWKCVRRASGFPDGCNALALGLLNFISSSRGFGDNFNDVDALLILESDCVITRRTWVVELIAEWEAAAARNKLVVGALQPRSADGGIEEHINAVALYDVDIACVLPNLRECPSGRGWDHHYGPSIVPYAVNSPLFKLDYRRETITAEQLFADPDVLVYHGCKDDSAIHAVRSKYNL